MDLRRLADIQVGTAKQCNGAGTGYLVSPRLVLTCFHVATDPSGVAWPRIEVRLGHPADRTPRLHLADLVWMDPLHDLALLGLRRQSDHNPAPARWGCLIGSDPVSYKGMGFPSFAQYSSGRGVEQIVGTLSPLSIGVDGGYVLDQLASPEPHPQFRWTGVSGTAVFCDDLIIGIVTKDDGAFASRRLHAARAYELFQSASAIRLLSEDLAYQPILEPVELRPFLQPPVRSSPAATPGSILAADIEAVRFTGRENLLRALADWRDNENNFSVRLVTGEGGQGKTRLAREFAFRAREAGWIASFVSTSSAPMHNERVGSGRVLASLLLKSSRSILIIIDYAETDPAFSADLIDEMMSSSAFSRVRVLLLSRVAGPWWHNQVEALTALDAETIRLVPLTTKATERRELYQLAVKCLAKHILQLTSSPTPEDRQTDWLRIAHRLSTALPDLSDSSLDNALTLHITALTDLLNVASGELPRRLGKSAESELVAHELAYIRRSARRRRLLDRGIISDRADPDDCLREAWKALEGALAAAILLGPCDLGQAHRIGRMACREFPLDIFAWLTSLYPPPVGTPGIGAVQPDRLAELLLGRILVAQPDLLFQIAAFARGIDEAISVLLTLLRTASHDKFAHINDLTRDLVATSDQFSRAAHILTLTIAEAASRHGDMRALGIIDLVVKNYEAIREVDQNDSRVLAGMSGRFHTVGRFQRETRPVHKGTPPLTPIEELVRADPRVLSTLLNSAMAVLGYQASQIREAGPLQIATGSSERRLTADRSEAREANLDYFELYPTLLREAYAIVGRQDAQDVVQNVFLSLYREQSRTGDVRLSLDYLRQMVANAARSYLRVREREVPRDIVGAAVANDLWESAYEEDDRSAASYYAQLAVDFEKFADRFDLQDIESAFLSTESINSEMAEVAKLESIALEEALRSLPEEQQTAIKLRYLAQASVFSTAIIMGVSETFASECIDEGIAALRRALV